jgi:hypothetical protein
MANKLETYRGYIQQALKEYASLGSPDEDVCHTYKCQSYYNIINTPTNKDKRVLEKTNIQSLHPRKKHCEKCEKEISKIGEATGKQIAKDLGIPPKD